MVCVFGLGTLTLHGQITSGKIIFERKTNLKKIFKDDERMRNSGMELDTRIEQFELYFNDTASAFIPVPPEVEEQGWGKYLTSHNVIYKDLKSDQRLAILDMAGRQMHVLDSISKQTWKITEKKRNLAGYQCRRAIWEVNDSTRIYAWFSVDLVPPTGPEGFGGLPGTILGLATEDGSVIYFAKSVEAMRPTQEIMTPEKPKKVFTSEELKKLLIERMGAWMKPKDIEAMFYWI